VGSRRRLIGLSPYALVLALTIAGAGIAGGRLIDDARDDKHRAALGARMATGVVQLDQAVDDVISTLVEPAAITAPASRLLSGAADGVVAVARLDMAGTVIDIDAVDAASRAALRSAVGDVEGHVSEVLGAARDGGRSRFGHVGEDTPGVAIAVRPLYGAELPPPTPTERRAALRQYLVTLVDVGVLVDSTLAPTLDDDDIVVVSAGRTLLHESDADEDADDVSLPLTLPGGDRWQVSAEAGAPSGTAPATVAAVGALLGAATIAISIITARARQRAIDDAAARDRELALMVDMGRLLQRSLDLAEILPGLAITLADVFDLQGCAVLLADERGALVETFAVGRRPVHLPRHASDIGRTPDEIEPGEDLVIPVERAGRAVGALWLGPRVGLPPHQVRAARAMAELVGSAIVNARAYERERDTARRMAELDQLKSDFLGTVSHELRTPSTAIQGFGSILEASWDRLDDDNRRDLVERIARNARSLSAMLNGLLDFARIERMSMHLERRPVDLGELVKATVEQTASLIEQHELRIDVAPGLLIWADPQAVERIVSNLLTNGAKYSPPDTTVTVAVTQVGERALLTVSDEGPGVSPRERSRIFSRFYRGDGEVSVRTRGAGIGLAVVKELVDRLDAEVDVVEAPGGGARFRVFFPLGIPDGVETGDVSDGSVHGATA
jgi:signal transduction histidine kinase